MRTFLNLRLGLRFHNQFMYGVIDHSNAISVSGTLQAQWCEALPPSTVLLVHVLLMTPVPPQTAFVKFAVDSISVRTVLAMLSNCHQQN